MAPEMQKAEAADSSKVTNDAKIISDENLIERVNDLQDKLTASGHNLDVPLPQIAVVGGQSVGKSSVLESIVGREFLPRGSGVVTRRPTIIQLFPSESEWAVFLHKPDERFIDFERVKEEIKNETDRELGEFLFSTQPINLKIYSPNVLKLTLVDLPGLIRCVVGNTPESVIEEVRQMVISYIEKPETLILAVTPANQDLANSEALSIAKSVDPKYERTIGVLTQIDIMNEGCDALDILENRVINLKRGYVGVVNRSQKDIEEKRDIQYILEKERKFFADSRYYRHIAHRMGTPYLQTMLHKQLRAHIRAHLPHIRNKLTEKYTKIHEELTTLKERLGENEEMSKQTLMSKSVKRFVDCLLLSIVGQSEKVKFSEITAGAHINYILYTEVQRNLNIDLNPDRNDLIAAMANIQGFRVGIAVPSLSFEALCSKLIQKYKLPLESSVVAVSEILLKAVEDAAKEVKQYPALKDEILFRVKRQTAKQVEIAKKCLISHVEAEMFYINIGHPDFESGILDQVAPQAGPVKIWDVTLPGNKAAAASSSAAATGFGTAATSSSTAATSSSTAATSSSTAATSSSAAAAEAPAKLTSVNDILLSKLQSNEATQKKVNYVSAMIIKYMEIVRKSMGDISIKYIVYFLVKQVLDYVENDLRDSLTGSNVEALMTECDEEFRRKEELEGTCTVIKQALKALQEF